MKTQEWAARAEIIASIAVIVTLGFVVYEVRQNTAAIERQTAIERGHRMQSAYVESEEFREIHAAIKSRDGREPVVAAFMDRYDLEMDDAVFRVRHLEAIWTGLETDFEFAGQGADGRNLVIGLLAYPDNRLYWQVHGRDGHHGSTFVRYVDDVITTEGIL